MATSRISLPGRLRQRRSNVEIPQPTRNVIQSTRRSTNQSLKRIQKRFRVADAEFYAIGKELNALNTPAVLAAFGVTTFAAFVEAELMAYSTAERFCVVAKTYPKALALRLGVDKAYHLARYVKAAGLRSSAPALARADKKLEGTRISTLSAVELENMVRLVGLRAANARRPRASNKEKRVARDVGERIEDLFGVDARVRVNKGRDEVRVVLKLSELMEE